MGKTKSDLPPEHVAAWAAIESYASVGGAKGPAEPRNYAATAVQGALDDMTARLRAELAEARDGLDRYRTMMRQDEHVDAARADGLDALRRALVGGIEAVVALAYPDASPAERLVRKQAAKGNAIALDAVRRLDADAHTTEPESFLDFMTRVKGEVDAWPAWKRRAADAAFVTPPPAPGPVCAAGWPVDSRACTVCDPSADGEVDPDDARAHAAPAPEASTSISSDDLAAQAAPVEVGGPDDGLELSRAAMVYAAIPTTNVEPLRVAWDRLASEARAFAAATAPKGPGIRLRLDEAQALIDSATPLATDKAADLGVKLASMRTMAQVMLSEVTRVAALPQEAPAADERRACGCVMGVRRVCVEHCGGHAIPPPIPVTPAAPKGPEPGETPDDRERAIVRRLAGEWGEQEVGPIESLQDAVEAIHASGTMFMRLITECGDWNYWARKHLGSKEPNDAKLRTAMDEKLAAAAPQGGAAPCSIAASGGIVELRGQWTESDGTWVNEAREAFIPWPETTVRVIPAAPHGGAARPALRQALVDTFALGYQRAEQDACMEHTSDASYERAERQAIDAALLLLKVRSALDACPGCDKPAAGDTVRSTSDSTWHRYCYEAEHGSTGTPVPGGPT